MSYILLREFLRPWALKLGARDDWQMDVFTDLVGPKFDRLDYIPFMEDNEPSVELIGRRFRCKATRDERRDDTLFVYEILNVGNERPTRTASNRWELARGDRWLSRGEPWPIPELRVAASPPPANAPAPEWLRRILAGLTPEEFFGLLPPLVAQKPSTLLDGMRARFEMGHPFTNIPINERERLMLLGKITPKENDAPTEVAALHARFGLSILGHCPNVSEQERVLKNLLSLPPPLDCLQMLVPQWLNAANRTDFEGRLLYILSWLEKCEESTVSPMTWLMLLKDTFTARVRSGPVSDRNLGKAFASWASLLQWAHATRLAGLSAGANAPASFGRSGPGSATHGQAAPAPAVGTALAASMQEAPAAESDPQGMLRSVLVRIRTGELQNARPRLFELLEALEQRSRDIRTLLPLLPQPEALLKTHMLLTGLTHQASATVSTLPDAKEAACIQADLARALGQIPPRFAPGAVASWLERLTTWEEVEQVLALLNSQLLGSLPEWFFRDLAPGERPLEECILCAAVESHSRSDLRDALAWLGGLTQTRPDAIDQLARTERADGDSSPLRLQRALEASDAERLVHGRLEQLVAQVGTWVRDLFTTADLPLRDALQSIEALTEQLERLAQQAPRVREELILTVAGAGNLRRAHAQLNELEAIFKPLGPLVGKLERLDDIRQFSAAMAQATPRVAEPSNASYELAHCISENRSITAARLVARKAPEQDGLYLTDIPLNVKTSLRGNFSFHLEVSAPYLANRPREWRQRVESITVHVSAQDWFPQGENVAASIVLKGIPIPATWATQPPPSLTLKVKGRELETQRVVEEKEFTFRTPSFDELQIELPFSDTTNLEAMRRHPLGIQVHFDKLVRLIQSGRSSFLIAAPRRFGKTTLLKALVQALSGKDSEVVVIAPKPAEPQTSITEKFKEICEQLGKATGAHVSTDWSHDSLLPEEETFDRAREAAAQQGKKAIYVLLDEAQALFARKRGKKAAEQLKSRIERAWGAEMNGMVPIRFGLVGQLHLQRLIAGQLDGVFPQTYTETEIRPELIEQMLREFTRDQMQSTQDARRLLADVSRNFFILQVLLDEIRSILSEEKRTWFVRSDVQRAMETRMEEALRQSRQQLVSYLRDPLNASDDLTLWQPLPAYPVAVAWAVVLADGKQGAARLNSARELLGSWAQAFSRKFIVPLNRIEECLQDLKVRLILGEDLSFCSPLLKSYFERVGKSASPLREPSENAALQTLVVDEVPIPEELQEIASGGQATVYRGSVDARDSAVRLMKLSGEQERLAFIEACYALNAIEGTRKRSLGYMSLPTVRAAGFSQEPEPQGLVIYDWVPGQDLTHFSGRLTDPVVVDIGRYLAEALSVLEQRDVLHRDIRLENIILQPTGVPVLVDFGLARLLGHSPVTPFQSPSIAPEAMKGEWSSKADVYALAWSLLQLCANRNPSSPVVQVLQEAMHPEVARRLNARQMGEQFAALADQMNVDSQRQKHEQRFRVEINQIASDLAREVASNHLSCMVATASGFFRMEDALQLAAQFVDDVFVAWHTQTFNATRHLTWVMNTDEARLPAQVRPLRQSESAATGYLRHGNAHRNTLLENRAKAMSVLSSSGTASYEMLKNAVVSTADRLEQSLQLQGMGKIVRAWLEVS